MTSRSKAKRCAYMIEKRGHGMRYVYSRTQCKRKTTHPSEYCPIHRPPER